jgi:hypothetical protein
MNAQPDVCRKPALSEYEFLLVASLQLGALKTLGVIIGANRFIELLLVPQLASESWKSPAKCDVQVSSKECDLQVGMKFINVAVLVCCSFVSCMGF